MKKRLHMELHLLRESWLRQCKKILFDFLKKRQYNYKKRVNSSQLGYDRCEKLVMECSK